MNNLLTFLGERVGGRLKLQRRLLWSVHEMSFPKDPMVKTLLLANRF